MSVCLTVDGVLDWILDLLITYTHTWELQALNNAIADLHTLQITRAHAKSFHSAFTSCFLVTYLNNEDYSAAVVTPLPLVNTPHLNCQLNDSIISSQHGPHKKHHSFVATCVFIAVGTCLPSRCLQTVAVYSPISWSLHSKGCTRYNTFINFQNEHSFIILVIL
jgi:hypothetical protein